MTARSSILILGLDPGLANMGYSIAEKGEGFIRVVEMGYFGSAKSDKKTHTRAASDNVRRWQEAVRYLDPLFARVDAVCAEAASFVRNASTMHQIGGTWGVVATLCEMYEHPLIESTPQSIKKTLAGANNATKEQVQEALDEMFGHCLGEVHLKGVKARSKWEHPYDGLGSIITGIDSDVVRAAYKAVVGKAA